MCGNFGLLLVPCTVQGCSIRAFEEILREQIERTRIRGAQAAGLSLLSTRNPNGLATSPSSSPRKPPSSSAAAATPTAVRVRVIPTKRASLTSVLLRRFRRATAGLPTDGLLTCVGHLRFATSSKNHESELHPHQWLPLRKEAVWRFHRETGTFTKDQAVTVGVHITHNGDFISYRSLSGVLTEEQVGILCGLVLHKPSSVLSDSAKIAGMMDLLHVKGRWGAAARLGYLRSMLAKAADCSSTGSLHQGSTSLFPGPHVWSKWEHAFEHVWIKHRDHVICVQSHPERAGQFRYTLSLAAVANLEAALLQYFSPTVDPTAGTYAEIDLKPLHLHSATRTQLKGFVRSTVRGFLRGDLYTAMSEFLHKAQGSFGILAHSPLEAGVVIVASKGQPMALSFREGLPMALFASEAAALEVPMVVDETGAWGFIGETVRLDLDGERPRGDGEVARVGPPSDFVDGRYAYRHPDAVTGPGANAHHNRMAAITVTSDIEIRVFSLMHMIEWSADELQTRLLPIGAIRDHATTIVSHLDPLNGGEVKQAVLPADDQLQLAEMCIRHGDDGQPDLELGRPDAAACDADEEKGRMKRYLQSYSVRSLLVDTVVDVSGVTWERLRDYWDHIGRKAGLKLPDLVAQDIADIPRIIARVNALIRGNAHRPTERAITALVTHLIGRANQHADGTAPDNVDLVVTGEEASLWIAEQFVADLKLLFPALRVLAIEANRLLGLGEPLGRSVYYSGHATQDELSFARLKHACCLLVSQSGQTYPTLQRMWFLVGTEGTQMEMALRKVYDVRGWAYRGDRVMLNMAGFRPAEPTSVAIVAAYHTLSIVLLKMLQRATSTNGRKHVCVMDSFCADEARSMLLDSLVAHATDITGTSATGEPAADTSVHQTIVKEGRRLGRHVQEVWTVLLIAAAYIFITVVCGVPLTALIVRCVTHFTGNGSFTERLHICVAILDALVYIYIAKLVTWGVRVTQGRPLGARLGKRTMVIVDYPCIHQLAEAFVTKLYALSYGFTSLDVHSASGVSDFVHKYTHRAVRGVLLIVGRPDGRMSALTSSEAAVVLGATQAALITTPDYQHLRGNGPELLSVGHNPYTPPAFDRALVLPTHARRKTLLESLYETSLWCERGCESGVGRVPRRGAEKRRHMAAHVYVWQQQHQEGVRGRDMSTSMTTILNPASAPPRNISTTYGVRKHPFAAGSVLDSSLGSTVTASSSGGDVMSAGEGSMDSKEWTTHDFEPHKVSAFAEGLGARDQSVLASQRFTEYFYESRVAALERYVAFCVLFHSMAEASQPVLYRPWDMAFSQSSLRVATTAAPIVARPSVLVDADADLQDASSAGKISMAIDVVVGRLGHNMCI